MNLARINDYGVARVHHTTFPGHMHFDFTGQEHKGFLHVLMKVPLERRISRQNGPVQHLNVTCLERLSGCDDAFQDTWCPRILV
jgi:hypothetical protein